jgi:hypothetical protein
MYFLAILLPNPSTRFGSARREANATVAVESLDERPTAVLGSVTDVANTDGCARSWARVMTLRRIAALEVQVDAPT